MDANYVVVQWPESQELMDKDWFDECVLLNHEKEIQDYGSSAYLVPVERLKELT